MVSEELATTEDDSKMADVVNRAVESGVVVKSGSTVLFPSNGL